MDPFRFTNQPIPATVTEVAGCDCGGTTMHRTDCSLFALPPDVAKAAIEDAEDRIQAYVDDLSRQAGWRPVSDLMSEFP